MEHVRVPWYRILGSVTRRLRHEGGFGLIELVLAMTVLNVGVLAIFAGFSSGYAALNRATSVSSGSALADAQMERFRALPFSAICLSNTTTDSTHTAGAPSGTAVPTCSSSDPALVTIRSPKTGPDGTSYRIDTFIVWQCAVGDLTTTGTYTTAAPGCIYEDLEAALPLKLVRITVRDYPTIATVYATEESTFDEGTGS